MAFERHEDTSISQRSHLLHITECSAGYVANSGDSTCTRKNPRSPTVAGTTLIIHGLYHHPHTACSPGTYQNLAGQTSCNG